MGSGIKLLNVIVRDGTSPSSVSNFSRIESHHHPSQEPCTSRTCHCFFASKASITIRNRAIFIINLGNIFTLRVSYHCVSQPSDIQLMPLIA